MSRSGPPAMASIAALFYTAAAAAMTGTVIAAPVNAQNAQAMVRSPAPNEARRRLFASHTSERIEVDGRLDEAAWRRASSGGDFVQHFPDVEKPASQRTEARVLVDGAAVYVGMRLYDSAPDSIAAPLARRDFELYSDWAHVIIDSYNDRRTAFRFMVNPAGVQRDALLTGDQEWNEDFGWDAVWSAATTRDSTGWIAELRIPLSQLRFSVSSNGQTLWGLQFGRHLARRNERSYWSPVLPAAGGFVSQFGLLDSLRLSRGVRRIELVPYTLAQMTQAPAEPDNPLFRRNATQQTVGGDLRLGLSQELTLTATLNPDFGQVEADPSEVNLTGLESFFSERRPFFLEGNDLFAFNMSSTSWITGREELFYSRRIGRAPQGEIPDDAHWSDTPTATPVRAAMKVTGRTRSGWSMAAMGALTGEAKGRIVDDAGLARSLTTEPATRYGVARLKRDFEHGESSLGTMLTLVDRDPGVVTLRDRALVAGIDGRRRFGGRRYLVSGQLLASSVSGTREAMIETQRGIGHLFQRPDAQYVEVDSNRTSLGGIMSEVQLSRVGGGHARWGLVGKMVTPGFEANDLGIQPRADVLTTVGWLGWEGFKPSRLARNWETWANGWAGWSFGGERYLGGYSLFSRINLHNDWEIAGSLEHNLQTTSLTALRGGPALVTPSRLGGTLRLTGDSRRAVVGSLMMRGAHNRSDGGFTLSVTPSVTGRIGSRTQLSVAPEFMRWRNPQQFIETQTTNGSSRYLVGELLQSSASLTLRASHAFSPRLSLQLYAQPFVSAGEYRRFGEVADPRASALADRVRVFPADSVAIAGGNVDVRLPGGSLRFERPDYTLAELRSNSVLRWEYRPGSTLFLVWSQGRSYDGAPDRFGISRQAQELIDAKGTGVFLIKISHWIGR